MSQEADKERDTQPGRQNATEPQQQQIGSELAKVRCRA